jgi:DNA-binding transcriptional regulator/RsmH inhibitor MraZ
MPSSMREMYFALSEERPMVLFTPKEGEPLQLYPASEWKSVQERTASKARQEKKPHLTRMLNAKAHPIPLEKEGNGRILIPQGWADYFKPDGDVIFMGNNQKIELWNAKDYQNFMNTHEVNFEDEMGDLLDY